MTPLTGQTVSQHRAIEHFAGPTGTMTGTTCLITGASSGIGKEIARGLAVLGATVVMVCRDRLKGELTREEIIRTSGNRSVDLLLADLSDQSSIHWLAEEFRQQYSSLEVLVNNAGVLLANRTVTADGFETTIAVNHLAPFLLTNLLLTLLKKSAPARIINLGSASHTKAMDFDNLQGERSYKPMKAYGQSKLGNILFTYELARRLAESGVTANCVDPGLVRTDIVRDMKGVFRLLIDITSPFYRTPARGARTVIYLASAKNLEGVTGRYFRDEREIRSARISYDPEVAGRLWTMSARMTCLAAIQDRPGNSPSRN